TWRGHLRSDRRPIRPRCAHGRRRSSDERKNPDPTPASFTAPTGTGSPGGGMSTDRRHLSPFQFSEMPDGSMGLSNYPHVTLHVVDAQGTVGGRPAWETALKMPRWYEAWESMARLRSEARCGRITFIIMDESTTNLVGHP